MPRLREEELSVSFSDGSEDGFRGVDYPRSVLPNRNITSDDNNDWPASAEAQTRRSGARNWDKNKRGRNQSASSRPKERSRSVSVSRKRGPKTTRATNHKNSSGKKSDRVPSTKKREAKRAAIRKYKSMPSEEEDQHHAFPEVGRISSEDEYVIRSPDYHDDDDDDDDERKSSDREMKKHQPMSPQKKHSKGRMQRHENLQQSDDEIMGEQLKRKHSSKEKITDTTNRRRRSASVDRIRNPEVKEIVRRKTPSRTKSDEKPKARQVKSEKSNRTDESKKMSTENTTTPQRKKSISKRAKSKERRTAKNHIGESHCYGTDDELLYDERGLPTTSVGCPPVATLPRTVSPNCVETERFYTLYAQKLREEEDEYDRGAKRLVCQSEASLVPFSPQETFHPIPIGCLEQRKRAKDFVRCLQTVLQDNNIPDNAILEPVLTNGELIELVDAMFNTQALFEKQGKPPQVEIGYHFCRGSNLRKIKTHPGLWSKIQKRGINASEDGEGIYTFNNPMSSKGASLVTHDDSSWMVIARIQGRHETFVANPTTNCRRKWHHGVDTLVWGGNQQSDDSLVVLKTSSQFFPLLHFRSTLLLGDEANSQRNDLYRQIQNFHLELQNLLDQFFNNRKSKAHGRKRPMSPFEDDKKHPARDQRKIPAATINTPHRSSQKQDSASPKPRQRPRTFSESVGAISNIEAWTLAHEVHEVVEELAMAANVTASFSPPFSVQPVLSKEETAVLADNMFHTQRLFKAWNKPYSYVEIGYHYCRQQSLEKMQELPGFWFNVQKQGYSKSEGGEEGIYVFNNPLSSRNRRNRGGDVMGMQQDLCNNDDVWLLGARIQGCPSTSPTGRLNAGIAGQWEEDADALVVKDVVVLRKASQFFPLLQFKASAVRRSGHPYHDGVIQQIQMVHQRLQGILDGFYNCLTSPEESTCGIHARLPSLKEEVLEYTAPEELDVMWSIHSPILKIYDVHASNKKALKDDCAICLDSLRKTAHHKVARLKVCNHEFHER